MSLRARGSVGRSGGAGIDVTGLTAWVTALKGPEFRDVNAALRAQAYQIAKTLEPEVAKAVLKSKAPQARAMSTTVRAKSDRVPVVVIGKVNPSFNKVKRKGRAVSGFTRRGKGAKAHAERRGALAHGVVYGPKGGKRSTVADENYYAIPRDESGGPVGRYLKNGPAMEAAAEAWFEAYRELLRRHGIKLTKGRPSASVTMSKAA